MVTIDNSVQIIGYSAFFVPDGLQSALTKVTIGNSVQIIGGDAFSGTALTLTEVVIPNSVQTIYDRAFYGCTALREVFIPNSVTHIWGNAFEASIRLIIQACPAEGRTSRNKVIIQQSPQ